MIEMFYISMNMIMTITSNFGYKISESLFSGTMILAFLTVFLDLVSQGLNVAQVYLLRSFQRIGKSLETSDQLSLFPVDSAACLVLKCMFMLTFMIDNTTSLQLLWWKGLGQNTSLHSGRRDPMILHIKDACYQHG